MGYRSPLLLLSFLLVTGCHTASADTPALAPVVRVQGLRPGEGGGEGRYSAVVRANRQVELDFKATGYVRSLGRAPGTSRALQEGDHVPSGLVLASVDAADYAARVETARAAVQEASAAEQQARRDRARSESLAASGAVTPVELEQRTTQLEAAAARLARAQATLHEAELALGDTSLRAPFAGTILTKAVEQGAFVTPRTPGFVLADDSAMKVVFGVPDRVVLALRVGQRVNVELPSLGKRCEATLTRVAPAADPRSRVFEIEATLPTLDGQVKVGMASTVSLAEGAATEAGLAVPVRSLVRDPSSQDKLAVFVVDPAQSPPRASLRPVELASLAGDEAIVSGLAANDRVVTLGAALLRDGDTVRLVP